MTAATFALLIDGSTGGIRPAAPHDEDAVRLSVSTSVSGGCWMCSTASVQVSEVSTTFQLPWGHTADELGAGGGIVGENVICPLRGVMSGDQTRAAACYGRVSQNRH
jgi:hypothetical protein